MQEKNSQLPGLQVPRLSHFMGLIKKSKQLSGLLALLTFHFANKVHSNRKNNYHVLPSPFHKRIDFYALHYPKRLEGHSQNKGEVSQFEEI